MRREHRFQAHELAPLKQSLVKNVKDRYVPFGANRLAKIHDVLDKLKQYQPEVCYVNTKENPADLLTRVRTVKEFKEQFDFWVKGLDFFGGGSRSVAARAGRP
jgi:hypothetical protein